MSSGGNRPGSGRKSVHPGIKRVQTTISISPETKKKMMVLAKEHNIRIGRYVDTLVDNLYQDYEKERNL